MWISLTDYRYMNKATTYRFKSTEWIVWGLAWRTGCVWLVWSVMRGFRSGYYFYVSLLQGWWYSVDVADSLTFIFKWVCFLVLYPYDTSREHISYFLHWLLVFEQQVESFLYSLSRYRLLFYQIPFCQLCVNWFVDILDPVKRVDLVEGY